MKQWILGIGIIVCGIIIATGWIFFSFPVGNFFSERIFGATSLLKENAALLEQVTTLKNEIDLLKAGQHIVSDTSVIVANVFSVYPFNTKNRIFINKGVRDGVKISSSVAGTEGVFIGIITQVSDTYSEVETIFDPSFSLPVRIGQSGVDGLLQGGATPRIVYIDKTKTLHIGDAISAASKEVPYGIAIGTVNEINEESGGTFFDVTINTPYVIRDLRTVEVLTQ